VLAGLATLLPRSASAAPDPVDEKQERGIASPDAPSGLILGGGLFVGASTCSYTRVRENQDKGTKLSLAKDLGIPVIGEARIDMGWRFDPDDALTLGISYIFAWGETRLDHDIHYNGAVLEGGTDAGTMGGGVKWFVLEVSYERILFRFGENGRGYLAADMGLRFDALDWRFTKKTFVPGTKGTEAGEDFLTQAIPIPVFGLSARFPLAHSVDLIASLRGFRINHLSSGRSEGGIVYASESLVDAKLGLAFTLSDATELSFGYRFLYVDMDNESREDGNVIGILAHGLFVTLTVIF